MEWSTQLRSWEREADKEEPVGNRPESSTNRPNHLRLTRFCVVITSCGTVVVAVQRKPRSLGVERRRLGMTNEKEHVSRQSSNSGRRKGTVEGPGRVQAGDRREVRPAILHHKSGWGCCSSISLRGM